MDATQNKSNLNPFSTFLIIGTAWAFDALDVGLLSFVMPLIRKEWLLTQSQTGLVSSVSSIGMIAGGFLFGHLADKVGRQKTLIASLLLFSLGNVVLAFTQGFVPFLIVRFIVGAGLGGELPVAATYIAELYSGKKRSMMLILADSFWAVGWLVAAFLSYALSGLLGWRGLLIVTACSGFFVVAIRKHVSDSDDVKQNTKEKFDFNALKQAFTWRTPLLWTAWFMVMFSYYGMFMWLPSILVSKGNSFVSSFGYTTLMVVAQLPGYFGAAWLTKHVRLRSVILQPWCLRCNHRFDSKPLPRENARHDDRTCGRHGTFRCRCRTAFGRIIDGQGFLNQFDFYSLHGFIDRRCDCRFGIA